MALRAKILTKGDSQTVELPEAVRFPAGDREVLVHREGNKVILEPVQPAAGIDVEQAIRNGWTPEFLAVLGSLKDEDIPRPRQQPITQARNPFDAKPRSSTRRPRQLRRG
jgi:virulence-associated protein VagC